MKQQPACRNETELFFDEDNQESVETAKALCAVCPMFTECRALYFSFEDRADMYGVWFGSTREERRELKE